MHLEEIENNIGSQCLSYSTGIALFPARSAREVEEGVLKQRGCGFYGSVRRKRDTSFTAAPEKVETLALGSFLRPWVEIYTEDRNPAI